MLVKVIIVAAMIAAIVLLGRGYRSAMLNVQRLQANQIVLLSDIDRYKLSDSLNAAQAASVRLTLSEYKKLYADECETVKKLKSDLKGLQSTVNAQTETIRELKAAMKPVVVHDTITMVIDTLQCFEYSDKWLDVSGCLADDTLSLHVSSRDELLAVESLQRKRFLGIPLPIKWFGYKTRSVDVVSMNPNTTIKDITYKTIEQ